MKKFILTSIAVISLVMFINSAKAQSQRLVLFEEFTQASCYYCGLDNPALNALLDANTTKIVPIKYQTYWPGTDPMNLQNPSQSLTRVNYYGVASIGVPYGVEDGNIYAAVPTSFTQADINSEYAVASPFTMTLTHSFDPACDSVYIACKIKCTQAISVTGPMKCQIVMTEQHIHYATAPGTNGETDFYEVMREMYPTDQGTTLSNTWAVGDSLIINIRGKVPTYIYNIGQIAIVAFIQDNATKNVKQAAYSAPQPLPLDAGVISLSVPSMQCTSSFTPTVYLKNFGADTITSATIKYRIDNGTLNVVPWTGTLPSGDSVLVTLPTVTITTSGTHIDSVFVKMPNGITDVNPSNDKQIAKVAVSITTAAPLPLTQGFEGSTYPPADWIILNPSNGSTWYKYNTGGFSHSSNSSEIPFMTINAGVINDLIAPPIDLSTATVAKITFSVAHCQYSTSTHDTLQVLVSTDCDSTWHIVYNKYDPSLASTTIISTTSFVPVANQWRSDTIDLHAYLGQSNVFIIFRGISGKGNNLFIDDINISSTIGINEIANPVNNINVYPNPFSNNANVEFSLTQSEKVSFNIYNLIGEKVFSSNENVYSEGKHIFEINADNLSSGIYYLKATMGDRKFTQKLTIVK